MQQMDYTPRLPSANAFDYYYVLGQKAREMPYETKGLPLSQGEVGWLRRNQSVFRTLTQAQSRAYSLPAHFKEANDLSYLASYRQLARAVDLQIRWHISENDGLDAVRDWRAGFKMACDMQGDLVLNLLTGIACERTVHTPIAQNLSFFSARESREIAHALVEAETRPDRIASVIEGEAQRALRELQKLLPEDPAEARRHLLELHDEIAQQIELDSPDDTKAQHQQERQMLEDRFRELIRKPAVYAQLRAELERRLRRQVQERSEAFALKGGKFRRYEEPPRAPTGDALHDYLLKFLDPLSPADDVAQRYWETRTRRRLPALHFLIREYYLRERRYPDHLRQLPIGDWAIDPFSGVLPVYRREGDGYRLYSVGVAGNDLGGYRRQPTDPPDTPENLFVLPGASGAV